MLPSLWEGFGLPVGEALAAGTRVACSDLPALREMAGEDATYFDPTDPAAIAEGILEALSRPRPTPRRGISWDDVAGSVAGSGASCVVAESQSRRAAAAKCASPYYVCDAPSRDDRAARRRPGRARVLARPGPTCLREAGLEVSSADVVDASARRDRGDRRAARAPCGRSHTIRCASPACCRRAVCISTSRLGSGALGADRPFHRAARGVGRALPRRVALPLARTACRRRTSSPGATPPARATAPRRAPWRSARTRATRATARTCSRARAASSIRMRATCASRTAPRRSPPGISKRDDWLSWLTSIDVLVSLPPEPGPGTDWCELAPAVMNGAVVLTTAESDFGPLEPGEDVAAATSAGFADSLRRLLADDERRERMRASALARLEATPARRDAARRGDRVGRGTAPSRARRSPSSRRPRADGRAEPPRVRHAPRQSRRRRRRARAVTRARSGGADRIDDDARMGRSARTPR